MKLINLFIIIFFLLLYACNTKPTPEKEPETEETSIESVSAETPEEPEVPEPVLNLDSICLDSALKYALKVAQTTIATQGKLEEYYEVRSADSSRSVIVRITMGHLFSRWQQHLVLRRDLGMDTHVDIFELKNGQFKGILMGEITPVGFMRDTIFDVNGDGAKDYLTHSYSPAGCCLRNAYAVYLNRPTQNTFAPKQEFINPTFSPAERLIRGIGYGYPEDGLDIYKLRWNGLKAVPMERIYHDYKVRGQFIKVKHTIDEATKKDSIVLKALPREYRNIEDINWFMYY